MITFQYLLLVYDRFIYTDKTNISSEYVMHILYASKKYGLPSLGRICHQFIEKNLSATNACILFEQCKFLGEEDLATKCLQLVVADTASAFKSDSFLQISQETLDALLGGDELSIPELEVFRYCLKWANAKLSQQQQVCDGPGYRRVLGSALFKIRIPTLSMDDYGKHVSGSKILTEKEELDIFRYLAAPKKPVVESLQFPTTPRVQRSAEFFLSAAALTEMAFQRYPDCHISSTVQVVSNVDITMTAIQVALPRRAEAQVTVCCFLFKKGQRRYPTSSPESFANYKGIVKEKDIKTRLLHDKELFFVAIPLAHRKVLSCNKNIIEIRVDVEEVNHVARHFKPHRQSLVLCTANSQYTLTDKLGSNITVRVIDEDLVFGGFPSSPCSVLGLCFGGK